MIERTVCAHNDKEVSNKCPRPAAPGHIFCDWCRIECGGYIRYTLVSAEAIGGYSTTALQDNSK